MAKEFNPETFGDKIYKATMELVNSTVEACERNPESALAIIGATVDTFLNITTNALINGSMRKHTSESNDFALEIARNLAELIEERGNK